MNYNTYLQGSHWKETRENKLFNCSHCQICNTTKSLHIHHKRYAHYSKEHEVKVGRVEVGTILGKEKKKDLFVLCASCHRLWHHYYGKIYLRHKIASKIRRLIKYGVKPKFAFAFSIEKDSYTSLLLKLKG